MESQVAELRNRLEELESTYHIRSNAVLDNSSSETEIAPRIQLRKRRCLSSRDSDESGGSEGRRSSRFNHNKSRDGSRHGGYSSENMISDIEGSGE